ncbi:DUF1573 domain-containing protein [Segetibacter aerophilus]|uniref:DUF1573 domain-containing protein n=1 Tax=Segetibacter aerophilus TaxID=670293 RepID=A0A512BA92_9BACT|nr:DUF1573 domain-containing protein [Segetibacter aerophilus]GEO08849.1 hypothetical protein SAE01_13450 [Segetibacter aerophilus]
MKKITLVLTSLFVAAIVNAQTTTATTPAVSTQITPKADIAKVLEFKEENHDFGKIPYGKPVEFDVAIKNISSEPIKIENVKVGCGCTTPKYEQGKTYAPGETFKVTLGFSGYAEGAFEKYVDIFFNNGLTKQIKFHGTSYKVETPAPANTSIQKMKTSSK